MDEEKRGAGRPKNSLKHLQEIAACNAVIWSQSLPLTVAGIELAKNGNATMLKYFYDRIHGRVEDTPSIVSRLGEIFASLPEGFDPDATMAAVSASLWGTGESEEWTTAEARGVGREAIGVLQQMAKRGDKDSAALLARLYPVDTMLSLPERSQTMTVEEVRETMIQRYSNAWPWLDRAEVERMVDTVCSRRTDEESEDGAE